MIKVFVSHEFSKDPITNKAKVDKLCCDILGEGYLPISPIHLFSFIKNENQREEIIKMCFKLIELCDEVWVYGESEGCILEKEYALKINKKVMLKKV
jgi:hypothetical protein